MKNVKRQSLLARYRWWCVLTVLSGLAYLFCLPGLLFSEPASTVIYDRNGVLLGARIADDGQWRFPEMDSVPLRFKEALLLFEDRYFYWHPGFNPVSMAKALLHNIRRGQMQRGGSTISMQVIRLSRRNRQRSLLEKLREMVLATRLELRYTKDEILAMYASHAPFGGNVVGLDAASWRYFSRSASDLSWAEAAMLAVLPNAPSLIYPGKQQEALMKKRNRLLDALHEHGHIDSMGCALSKMEPIPGRPAPMPVRASHLLDRIALNTPGQKVVTSIDEKLQAAADAIVNEHARQQRFNEVHNAAAIILEVKGGEVLAYVGNSRNDGVWDRGQHVDMIKAARSTGSILKPFLYALMMQEGACLPNTLIPDIPTRIAGYSPKNYFLTYDGAVPAKRSLSRSLNVPSVRMLRDYGVEKFHHHLRQAGMNTLHFPPGHYGLSLILGGAEGSLWDLAGIYASMSRVLRSAASSHGLEGGGLFHAPLVVLNGSDDRDMGRPGENTLDAAAVGLTWEALVEVNRPDAESGWELYASPRKLAWKTGTSFGGRDAWAIGSDRDYVVGVWVGNASGEGRPGLTGLASAAPLMFDLFGLLPQGEWFEPVYEDMAEVVVCRESGHRAGMFCQEKDTVWVHQRGLQTPSCPYHQVVFLDSSGRFRVGSDCEEVSNMVHTSWFVLPPAMEWFYKHRNPAYRMLPPYRNECIPEGGGKAMEWIYPGEQASVFIPRELDGSVGRVVFEIAHRDSFAKLFWHLDGEYIGETNHIHRMSIVAGKGMHTLLAIDANGEELHTVFEVVN